MTKKYGNHKKNTIHFNSIPAYEGAMLSAKWPITEKLQHANTNDEGQ